MPPAREDGPAAGAVAAVGATLGQEEEVGAWGQEPSETGEVALAGGQQHQHQQQHQQEEQEAEEQQLEGQQEQVCAEEEPPKPASGLPLSAAAAVEGRDGALLRAADEVRGRGRWRGLGRAGLARCRKPGWIASTLCGPN